MKNFTAILMILWYLKNLPNGKEMEVDTMTVEERINTMNKKIAENKKISEEKEVLKEKEISEMLKEAEKLFGRVKDIIRLGRYCMENNLEFPNGKYHKYDNYRNDFESDGIRHYFGFLGRNRLYNTISEIHVGWENGGFCGDWDVHCDGNELWLQHEKDKTRKKIDDVKIVKQFIKDFEEFERNFYEWFDEKCK